MEEFEDEFTRRCDLRIENLESVKKRFRLEKNMISYYQMIGEINGITYARDLYRGLDQLKSEIANSNMK